MKRFLYFTVLSFAFFACAAQPVALPQVLTVNVTPDAQPWLVDVYSCADDLSLAIRRESRAEDIFIQLGEPDTFLFPAYLIGMEQIVVAVNSSPPAQTLSREQTQSLFLSPDESLSLWIYPQGADIQIFFEEQLMRQKRVSPLARLAQNPQEMLQHIQATPAVGILPARMLTDSVRAVFALGEMPVLAVMKQESQNALNLIACLQK